jgi:hypothetical protein
VNIPIESKGGAIAMITIRSIGQFSAEKMMHSLKNYSLWLKPIYFSIKLYEYQTAIQTATNVVFYLGDPA